MNEKITYRESAILLGMAGLSAFLWGIVIVEILFFIVI